MPSNQTRPAQHGPPRRTIVKGAAWAVPAVAVASAAPAMATSPCTPTTNFDALPVGQCVTKVTFPPSDVTATLSYESHGQGRDDTPGGTCQVARTSGADGWNYVELEMLDQLSQGDYVELTITLSEPVENLSFLLHDIDSSRNAWLDTVWVRTSGFSYSRGSNIQGVGSQSSPFRPINWGDTPINEGAGRVRLTWPGTVQEVKIRYIAGITGNSGNQHIGLGDISFSACVDPDRMGELRSRRGVTASADSTIAVVEAEGTRDT